MLLTDRKGLVCWDNHDWYWHWGAYNVEASLLVATIVFCLFVFFLSRSIAAGLGVVISLRLPRPGAS